MFDFDDLRTLKKKLSIMEHEKNYDIKTPVTKTKETNLNEANFTTQELILNRKQKELEERQISVKEKAFQIAEARRKFEEAKTQHLELERQADLAEIDETRKRRRSLRLEETKLLNQIKLIEDTLEELSFRLSSVQNEKNEVDQKLVEMVKISAAKLVEMQLQEIDDEDVEEINPYATNF